MKAPRSPQCGGHRQAPRPLRGAPSSRPLLLAPSSPRATRGARGVRLEAAEGRCPPRAVPPGGEASPTALRSPAGPTAGTEGNKRGRPGPAPARRLARGDRERAGPVPPSPAAPHLPAPAVRRLRGSQVVPPGPDLAAAAAGSSSRSSAAARGHAGTRPLGRPPPRRAAPSLRAVTARPPPSTRRAAWKERGPRAACPSPPLLSPPPRSAKLRSAGLPPRARAHPFSSAVRAPPLAPLPRALCPLPPRALGAGRPRPARPLARGRAAAPRPHPPSGSGFGSDQPHCASRQPDAPSRHSAATDRRAPRRGVGGAARETPARARGAWAVGERSGKGDQSGRGTASLGGRGEGRSAARPALPRKEIRLSVVNWIHVK